MSEKVVRFGILGCANIARKISRAITLAPNSTLYAIGSRSIEKALAFASENGFPPSAKVYGSYEAVLDDPDVDAVYVPLPTSLHLRWIVLAAEKKKHVLLEKPAALNVAELDAILEACDSNGVQFMDATMWMHHPRTVRMRELLSDKQRFGQLKSPDLDALGALGDVGWYCIGAILWAADYELPKTALALRQPEFNEAGVILSCASSLYWEDGKIATFYCSFLTNLTMDLTLLGTLGNLYLHDFVVPFQESVASFYASSQFSLPAPSEHAVMAELPQEAVMVGEFAGLVGSIEGDDGSEPEKKWPLLTRKTQLVLDAVQRSIERGFEPIDVVR
ncbi:hypothetical protein F0562_027430 [Nyssa sinensis]|uniref:Gfo/Idh/MocA-like oxidoreductase N-terminal domain-containing protein n=1 Tax=Nyssa sinensis TaxID=561372 RepID=A0A5J5B5V4_9ASTE|nr:hypothetical protein F0562_027430 [Nyssa sinensis]